jgi:hypothetical protein
MNIITKLILLADKLDELKMSSEADNVDRIIKLCARSEWKSFLGKTWKQMQDLVKKDKCGCQCQNCAVANSNKNYRNKHYSCQAGKCEIKRVDLGETNDPSSVAGVRG